MNYITIVGGDEREIALGSMLEAAKYPVRYAGFEAFPRPVNNTAAPLKESLSLSLVVILPLTGIDSNGKINAPYARESLKIESRDFGGIKAGTLFIAGRISDAIKKRLRHERALIYETGEWDDLALLNAVPTAEGAIQAAMEKSKITLHASKCLVAGFGRCGKLLSQKLKGLGAVVTVAARNNTALAEAETWGLETLPLEQLTTYVHEYDFIFNTIPALVLKKEILNKVKPMVTIIDIASKPGGVDAGYARKYGLNYHHLLGLPGKVAPVTAGKILFTVYQPLIVKQYRALEPGWEAK
ncbi:MAG TPA: dipicolinate synthase subunit DpsA [Firmicutes bacterium]|nr:dipicolinate synthase subunit DpsA [Bacillota bacterium]